MTDYAIPCDAIARLSHVLKSPSAECDEFFRALRYDNGILVASNRIVLAAEKVGSAPGIFHLTADPTLIEQCRKEAPFNSVLTVTIIDALKFATGKTTLGYVTPGNCCIWSDAATRFDTWRSLAIRCKEPSQVNRGGMFWAGEHIANLVASSPSGRLVFEEAIDAHNRPTVVRDINDPDWFGLFNPYSISEGHAYGPATLPTWVME